MSKKKNKVEEIQLRKKKLEDEINSIEEKYSRQATKISNGIQSTLKPIQTIRDNPIKSLGVSIAVGVVLGMAGQRKKQPSSSSSDTDGSAGPGDSGFTSLLVGELKRMAAKRAMIYISDIIDRKIMPQVRDLKTSEDDQKTPSGEN